MALNFNPFPILDPERYRRPNFQETVMNPISQGINSFVEDQNMKKQQERQAILDGYLREEQGRKQREHEFEYGAYPAIPSTNAPANPLSLVSPRSMFNNVMAADMAPKPLFPGRKQQEWDLALREKEAGIKKTLAEADYWSKRDSSEEQRLKFQEKAEAYQLKNQEKKEAEQTKIDEKMKQLEVPGYNRTGEVVQRPQEAQTLRDAVARFDKFEKGVNAMKLYVKQNGPFQAFGSAGANMNALATDLQLDAKELYNLGVLNGPDLMLISKMVADPSSMRSLFTLGGTRQSELDQVLNRMRQGLQSRMTSSGYSQQQGDVMTRKIRNKKTGEIREQVSRDGGQTWN